MITVTTQEPNETTRVLSVEVPKEEVDRIYGQVVSRYRQKANLPGFRRGKAPEDLVAKTYAREIREEVLDHLFSSSYREALQQTRLTPIQPPRLEKMFLDRGQPLSYQVVIEVLPKVTVGNYKGLKLKKNKLDVAPDEVDQILEKLRQQQAVLQPVEDRPARSGDVVTLDFLGRQNGEAVAGVQAEDYEVELGAGQTIEDFERQVAGMQLNERKTFAGTFPHDYQAAKIAGQTLDFEVTLKSIREKHVSDLSDEFARGVGNFSSLDELRERVRQNVVQEKEQRNHILLRDQIMKELGRLTKVSVPDALVERSLDKLVKDFENRMSRQGQTWDAIQSTPEAFKQKNREQVAFELKAQLGLREVSRIEAIEVTPADVEAEIQRMAAMARQPFEAVKNYLVQHDALDDLEDRLRDEKTIARIIELAKVTD